MIFLHNHPLTDRDRRNRHRQASRINRDMGPSRPNGFTRSQIVEQKRQMLVQQREYIEKKIKQLPLAYLVIHCFLTFAFAICLVVIQSVQLNNKALSAQIGCGIWIGCFYFIAMTISIFLIFRRTYNVLTAALILYFIGIFLCIVGMVATNPKTHANDVDSLNVALIVIEALCMILSIVFVCVAKSATCRQVRRNGSVRHLRPMSNQMDLNTISSRQNTNMSSTSNDIPPPPLYGYYSGSFVDKLNGDDELPPPTYNANKFLQKPNEDGTDGVSIETSYSIVNK